MFDERMISYIKPLQSMAFSKPFMLVLLGLSIGFSFSILLSSLFTNQCLTIPKDQIVGVRGKYFNDNYELHYKSKSEIESENVLDSDAKKHRIVRSRFLSTELDLKEKLLISVLTSVETLESFGYALNQTMTLFNTKSKFVFFMNGALKKMPPTGMHLIMFSEAPKHHVPFHMLKYLFDNYRHHYNWFYLFPDSTFLNSESLMEFVGYISVGKNLLIGSNSANKSSMCDFDAGILLSQSVLMHLVSNLPHCIESSSSNKSHSENVERCFHHAFVHLNITCSKHINKLIYQSVEMSSIGDFGSLGLSYNSFISYSKMTSDTEMYILFRKLAENNKVLMELKLLELQESSRRLLRFIPDRNSSTWPLGSEVQSRAKNRFDIIRWEYFNESYIIHDRFDGNIKALKGTDKVDVSETIKEALILMNRNVERPFTLKKFINGYRRFDSLRGMEYIIDFLLDQRHPMSNESKPSVKRIHLVRPLGQAEIIPMPYVTENTRVNLLLTVMPEERNDVLSFIDSFAQVCIESGDNSNLFIIFVYQSVNQEENDIYAVVKSTLSFYEDKYHNKGRIIWTSFLNNQPEQIELEAMSAIYQKLPKDSLVLTCTVGMELKIDFLNHVRMNTIEGWQVYFPIGYWSFKPQLVCDRPPYPTSILINQKSGRYGTEQYAHASFYLSDFIYCKIQMFSIGAQANFINLYEMFLNYHLINVFRAIDPKLRLHFKDIKCHDSQSKCLRMKRRSFASRSQLAMLLFEHQQKLDELQMDVMHQQQGGNIWHMEPDMLK